MRQCYIKNRIGAYKPGMILLALRKGKYIFSPGFRWVSSPLPLLPVSCSLVLTVGAGTAGGPRSRRRGRHTLGAHDNNDDNRQALTKCKTIVQNPEPLPSVPAVVPPTHHLGRGDGSSQCSSLKGGSVLQRVPHTASRCGRDGSAAQCPCGTAGRCAGLRSMSGSSKRGHS